jgi:hypothetical protein
MGAVAAAIAVVAVTGMTFLGSFPWSAPLH